MDGLFPKKPKLEDRSFVEVERPFWRILCIMPGLFLLGYIAASAVRDRQFDPSLSFVLSASIGLLFLGCLINSEWRAFASWASLGLIGQAAALQMIHAGRHI